MVILCLYFIVRLRDFVEYEGWIVLVVVGYVIFVYFFYLKSFIEYMGQYRFIESVKNDLYIIIISFVVFMLDVIECLKEIGCLIFRFVCYGQKWCIIDYFVFYEFVQLDYYKVSINFWDIGVNVYSEQIFFFRFDGGRSSGVEIYFMVIFLSFDFGFCYICVRYEGVDC